MEENKEIVNLLNEILLYEHRGSTKAVARAANCSSRTVNEACHNHTRNPAVDIIKAAWLVTGDPRLKGILEPDGYTLVPKKEALSPSQNLEHEIGDVFVAISSLLSEARTGKEKGFDKHGKIKFLKGVEKAEREIAEVKHLAENI